MTDPFHPPWPAGTRHLQVGDLRVDLRYRRLTATGQKAELPHRVFDLFLLLLAEPHVLHSRADLFERIWAGTIVEDANLSQSVWMLRRALGPARRNWIRTVAKAGYVFEPPALPRPVDDEPASAAGTLQSESDAAAAPAGGAGPAASTAAPRPARSRRRGPLAVAASGLLVLAASLGGSRLQPATSPAPPTMTHAVVLVDVDADEAGTDGPWPTALLHAWLDWKLDALPEVTLLTQAHLATDAGDASPTLVLLASSRDPRRPQAVHLRVRYYDAGGEHRMELRGSAADVPRMVDQLSRQLVARLLPDRAGAAWPALELDVETARGYAAAFSAYERRDWAAAAQRNREVIGRAPDFGLARLHLAYSLGRLGQAGEACRQMTAARRLLTPLPADADAVLDASALAMDPRSTAAAARAYGALARRHPGTAAFQLRQASLLGQSGQPEAARAILERPIWARQAAGVRAQRALALASVQMRLGAWERVEELADEAARLARPGPGWALERGRALLLRAQAATARYGDHADLSLFEQAAKEFESAGNHNDAMLSRFLARSALPPTGDTRQLDALLAQARAGGYRRLEIAILRRVAFQHLAAGRHAEYRDYLVQARAAANAAGDRLSGRMLDMDLLNEDMLRGDLASADRRVARLRAAALEGDDALWVAQADAALATARGEYARAGAILDHGVRRTRTVPAISDARLSCQRAELALQQGLLARARDQWRRCGGQAQSWLRLQASIGDMLTSLLAGDRGDAAERLDGLRLQVEKFDNGPERWLLSLQLAGAATRLGQSRQATATLEQVLPAVRGAGYDWLAAEAETGLAEAATARGEWNAGARHLANARALFADAPWVLESRLEEVEVALAFGRGEHAQAMSRLAALHRRAHELGDTIIQLETHSLMSSATGASACDAPTRAALVARTGLRGANLDWMGVEPRLHPAAALAASSPSPE